MWNHTQTALKLKTFNDEYDDQSDDNNNEKMYSCLFPFLSLFLFVRVQSVDWRRIESRASLWKQWTTRIRNEISLRISSYARFSPTLSRFFSMNLCLFLELQPAPMLAWNYSVLYPHPQVNAFCCKLLPSGFFLLLSLLLPLSFLIFLVGIGFHRALSPNWYHLHYYSAQVSVTKNQNRMSEKKHVSKIHKENCPVVYIKITWAYTFMGRKMNEN